MDWRTKTWVWEALGDLTTPMIGRIPVYGLRKLRRLWHDDESLMTRFGWGDVVGG